LEAEGMASHEGAHASISAHAGGREDVVDEAVVAALAAAVFP